MRFSEALSILEMEESSSSDVDDGLVRAYRKAMKKYHPDVTKLTLDFALEMSKLVNEAYSFLAQNIGKWSIKDKGTSNLADIMAEIYNKIRHIPHITIVRAGVWLWVTVDGPPEYQDAPSDTVGIRIKKRSNLKMFRKSVGKELSPLGFNFSGKHMKWSWHDVYDGPRWKKRGWEWNRIVNTFGSDELENDPRAAVA